MDSTAEENEYYRAAAALGLTIFESAAAGKEDMLSAINTTYNAEERYAAALAAMTLAMDTICVLAEIDREHAVQALRISLAMTE